MEKVIVTAMFIVIAMILAMMLFNIAYPAIVQGGDAIAGMAYNVSDRMGYSISTVHASGETSSDTNGNGHFEVFAWIKNVGDSRIIAINRIDVFFGPEGNFTRIPYRELADSTAYPYWTAAIVDETDWNPTGTLQISIHYSAMPIASDRYFIKVTLPNGVSSDYYLGL